MGYTNSLSWSFTRAKSFKGCPRAFYYAYYFRGEEPKLAKYANATRKLSNPDLLAGQVVDWQIRFALDTFRECSKLPADLVDRGLAAFRRQLDASPNRAQSMLMKGTAPAAGCQVLHNHFYQEPDDAKVIATCESKVENCIRNWLDSEVLERILATPTEQWMPKRDDSDISAVRWELGALTVYSSIDFWFDDAEGLHILDWKSGRASEESVRDASIQLSGYALWGVREMRRPPEEITTQMVFLQAKPLWDPRVFSEEDIGATEKLILGQHMAELDKLRYSIDENGNALYTARIDDYPVAPEVKRCHDCKFRIMCREGKALVKPYVGRKAAVA